jgi:epoxyqueuosine reductase
MGGEAKTILIDRAKKLGFLDCRVAKADFLESEAHHFEEWLSSGYHGSMAWLEKNLDLRLDPRKLVPGAKSVVVLNYNYAPHSEELQTEVPKIARYAVGRDYHKVVKKKLKVLLQQLRESLGPIEGRAFVDSAPVHERAWAEKSGLGWIGKNSLLLSKKAGSYFFLAVLIIDLDLPADTPVTDHCGSCTRCIDACPTDAIIQDKVIDSNRCISHMTIELKERIDEEYLNKLEGWAFGCDICQEVCPWNRFSTPHSEPDFLPHPELKSMNKEDWMELSEEVFEDRLGNTPLKRAGYSRFLDNVQLAVNSKQDN